MKKGQVAVIGFIVTVVLIIVVFQLFSPQITSLFERDSKYEELNEDADQIGDILLSEGYPVNWNEVNVKKVGLMDGDVLSMEALNRFAKLDYEKSKVLLGIKNDYMFFIEKDPNGTALSNRTKVIISDPVNKDFFGWNGYVESFSGNGGLPFGFFYDQIHSRAKNIAKTERFVSLEDSISSKTNAKIVIYTWDPIDLVYNTTECSDGINNDPWEDGWVDYSPEPHGIYGDPGCTDYNDDNESDGYTDLVCSLKNVCADQEEPVIELKLNPGDGGHASLAGSGEQNKICCHNANHFEVLTDWNCETFADSHLIARLDSSVNAHIQKNFSTTYTNKTCIRGTGRNMTCAYEDACSDGRECLFSFQNATGGHIGGCPGDFNIKVYREKICCQFI